MEASEEVAAVEPKDPAHIVKGKRTKRQRPQSPIPFTITTHNSSSGEAAAAYGGNNINDSSSPSPSDDEIAVSTTTAEDEDTARLLILLAQGSSRNPNFHDPDQNFAISHKFNTKKFIETTSNANSKSGIYDPDQDYFKFNSKRFIETNSDANGNKSGIYVYECKTCSRTFPSFQALGGHRASHKKPKNLIIEKKNYSFASSDDNESPIRNNNSYLPSPISNQTSNNSNANKSTSSKIHECSFCGAEFTSGQALGGHMRRHRGSNASVAALSPLSPLGVPLSPLSVNQDSEEAKKQRSGLSLCLDLNLPAPEDESKYGFAAKHQHQQLKQEQQQKKEPLILLSTTSTLVDCHY